MAVGNVLRDMFVNVFFKVNPASQQALNTSLTGSVLKANLLSQALEGFARTLARGIGQAVDNLARLNVVAARTNTTVEAIRNMQYAAQKMGVDMHGATAALENFQKQINQNPNYQKYWEDLIPDMKKVTDTSDKLMKIFEFLSKQPRYLAEAYNTKLGLGIPPDLFDVIMKQFSRYKDALEEHDKLMRRFKTTQKEAATASFELHQAFTKFGVIFDAFFTKATLALLPTFNKLLGGAQEKAEQFFDAWNKYGPQVEAVVKKIGDAFKDWGSFLGKSLEIVLLLRSQVLQIAASLLPIAVAVSAAIKLIEEERALKKQREAEEAEGRGAGPGTGPGAFERMRRMHTSQRDKLLESLGMGAQILPTESQKKVEQATQETAKNTAEIAKSLQQKSLWERTKEALQSAYNAMRGWFPGAGIGGAELPGGGAGGGTGGAMPGGGTGRGGPGGGSGSGRRGEYSAARAAALARKMGATEEEAKQLGALVGGESSGDPGATRINAKEHSIGLWQINQNAWKSLGYTDEQLKNPEINAKAAIEVLRKQGLNAWWNTSRSAGYQNDLAQAALGAANPEKYAAAAIGGGSIKASDLTGGAAARGLQSSIGAMNPDLRDKAGALLRLAEKEGVNLKLTSGARYFVPPGGAQHSQHMPWVGKGGASAADFAGDLAWAHRNAYRVGMHFPLGNDPMHGEVIGNRGWYAEQMRSKASKRFDQYYGGSGLSGMVDVRGSNRLYGYDVGIEKAMREARGRKPTSAVDEIIHDLSEEIDMESVGLSKNARGSMWRIGYGARNLKMNTARMPMSKNIEDMRQPYDVMFGKTPLSDSHSTFSPTSNVNMNNSNTFNMGGASPQEAVRVASLVGRENERAMAKLRNTASSKVREFAPRVT